ncbi:MAG TPA: DUF5666 domain-containing protein [Anaerolineales bacterium]|nr:DUF5666 domain-containing protein [Anaerolineales bacterium]
MNRKHTMVLGYLGILALMLACATVGIAVDGAANTPGSGAVLVQLEDGVVEVQDEDGDWTPVAGDSAFDVIAPLESTDPWRVAGVTLETNESTQIEEGLQIGELVRVRGAILEDGTWLAHSIERAEEQVDPIIILIGIVDSMEPWVVNGIELNVTEETEITGVITPGMIVRVEILLLADGTWEVLSITPLGEVEEDPDCGTVVATVVSIEGNVIQFAGWPEITIGEDVQIEGGEVNFSPDQTLILVVCPSEEGQIVIVNIIIINGEDETPDQGGGGGEKVLVCHKPDKKGGHTLSIAQPAVPAHLGHGDTLGPCP